MTGTAESTRVPGILPLRPYLREAIWGGRRLAEVFGKTLPPSRPIGEAWEVSAYQGAECTIAAGPLRGQSLGEVVRSSGVDLLGEDATARYGAAFPLLIKFLDARDDLSVQVHPDDSYVRELGLGTYGKMEAWYVLDSAEGRIVHGLKAGVGKPEFEDAMQRGRLQDVLRSIPVSPGDVVFVPPGTVHALCAGVMVYEVQQSSDLTFRLWDYDRRGADGSKRALHVERALDVIAFAEKLPEPRHWTRLPGTEQATLLVASEHFRLERFAPDRERSHEYASFAALTLLEGRIRLQGDHAGYEGGPGDTFFIPAGRPVNVTPVATEPPAYLIASVP